MEDGTKLGLLEHGNASAQWLRECEGFRVDSPDGRVGIVEEVRFDSPAAHPEAVVVRAGFFGRRVLVFAIADVKEILPREMRLVLRASPHLLSTESAS